MRADAGPPRRDAGQVCETPTAGCACDEPGASFDCYTGPVGTENVGTCRGGTMTCVMQLEFASWSACEGQVTPSFDRPNDGIDQDCTGADFTDGCTPTSEDCMNGRDDDCDGLADCSDTRDCSCEPCVPSPFGEVCGDLRDNDCDGLIDCEDMTDCRCG